MPTVQTTHHCSFAKIILQDAETVYPFSVPIKKKQVKMKNDNIETTSIKDTMRQ
jgi:hypothetical protein